MKTKPAALQVHNATIQDEHGEWFMSRLVDGRYSRVGYVAGKTLNHERLAAESQRDATCWIEQVILETAIACKE